MKLTTRRLKNIIAEEVKRAARGRRLNEVDQSGVESEAKAALLAPGQALQSQGGDQDEARYVLVDLVDAVALRAGSRGDAAPLRRRLTSYGRGAR